MKNEKQKKGKIGEEFMVEILLNQNWKILERNYRRRGCEIDIIAEKKGSLIFVEVKFRKNFPATSYELEALVPYRKQIALNRGVHSFLNNQKKQWDTIRIDLAVVTQKSPAFQPGFEYYTSIMQITS